VSDDPERAEVAALRAGLAKLHDWPREAARPHDDNGIHDSQCGTLLDLPCDCWKSDVRALLDGAIDR